MRSRNWSMWLTPWIKVKLGQTTMMRRMILRFAGFRITRSEPYEAALTHNPADFPPYFEQEI
jgi:hypothetical protein